MINGKRIVAVIVGALVVTATGYADMVPASGVDIGRGGLSFVCGESALPANSPSLFGSLSIADLDLWSVNSLPQADAGAGQTVASHPPQTLVNGPDSLALCLSALMGLGLCSSVHWVKRLSFGFIPDWYHNGGPSQVGHSHAVNPNTLCPVPAYCFIQPVCTAQDIAPQYRLGTFMSLWRESQFTPLTLSSRGPPAAS